MLTIVNVDRQLQPKTNARAWEWVWPSQLTDIQQARPIDVVVHHVLECGARDDEGERLGLLLRRESVGLHRADLVAGV